MSRDTKVHAQQVVLAAGTAIPSLLPEGGWVEDRAHVGTGTRLWHQAQIAVGATVGGDCTLGKGAYVGAGSSIGDLVKIGNYACIFGARIAARVMICPGALLLEDPAPRATTPDGRRKQSSDFIRRPSSSATAPRSAPAP